MDISIGKFNSTTKSVEVTFSQGNFSFKRNVNAVLNEDNSYDSSATQIRVNLVAAGVANKANLGVISKGTETSVIDGANNTIVDTNNPTQ
jgi:hypothetical protein